MKKQKFQNTAHKLDIERQMATGDCGEARRRERRTKKGMVQRKNDPRSNTAVT